MCDNFTQNVIAGLVSALIVIFFNEIWLKIIYPFFIKLHYSGINLEGQWLEESETSLPDSSNIKINQTGRNIRGEIQVTKNTGHRKTFKLTGHIKGQAVSLHTWNANNKEIGVQSYTFTLLSDGYILAGKKLHYEISSISDDTKIVSTEIRWIRQVNEINSPIKTVLQKK